MNDKDLTAAASILQWAFGVDFHYENGPDELFEADRAIAERLALAMRVLAKAEEWAATLDGEDFNGTLIHSLLRHAKGNEP